MVRWMYKVDVYLRVRRAVMVDGMSIREAARVAPGEQQAGLCTNLSRRTRWCARQGRPGCRPPALDTCSGPQDNLFDSPVAGSLPAAAACWAGVGAAALRRARPSLRRAGGQPQRPGCYQPGYFCVAQPVSREFCDGECMRISPPFPIKVLPEHFHALIADSRSSIAASWFARLRPERHEQACTSRKR